MSSFTYGDHGFDDKGNLISVPEYRKFELRGAFEYGLRSWLTLVAEADLREESVEQEVLPNFSQPEANSYGAIAGGARLQLFKAPNWVLSGQLVGLSGGFASSGLKAPSDGPALETRLLAGYGTNIYGKRVFADLQAAYRFRVQEEDSDEIKVDFTVGTRPRPRWMLLAQSFSTWETDNDVSYHKVSGSVVRKVNDKMQIAVSGIATVAGRNAVRELGGSIGFWYTY
ncbi:MAG: hypothetical protein AAF580_11210 [Pseudomonadota bacterium]